MQFLLPKFVSVISVLSVFAVAQGQNLPQGKPPVKHVGNMFIFTPGPGACGFTNTSSQIVASVSQQVFKSFPGATANPNKNPICRRSALITYAGKSLTAPIVDYFTDPGKDNVGLSLPGFTVFASEDEGIVEGVTWTIV